mgnify:CR=1 FL=1
MAEHHHHSSSGTHHHHSHKMDAASKFKRQQLKSIELRKKTEKYLFRGLCILAVIMAILVVLAYTIG